MLNNMLDLLRADGSILVNKKLIKKIGLEEAIVYSELASQYNFWSIKGELVNSDCKKSTSGEWFFCTVEKLEEHTTIKRDRQLKIIKNLKKMDLLETKLMGLPSKRYFRITEKIFSIMFDNKIQVSQNAIPDNINVLGDENTQKQRSNQVSQNAIPSKSEMRQLEIAKCDTINNISINNISINKLEEEDPEYAAAISAFQENIIGNNSNVSKTIQKQIKEFMSQLPVEIIINEIEYAATNNAKTFNYIKKALIEDVSMEIDSIAKLEQKRKDHAAKHKVTSMRSYGRKKTENVPEWFEKHKTERQQGVVTENKVSPELELQRQELLKSLGVEFN